MAGSASGCAAGRAFRKGRDEVRLGNWDAAVTHFTRAVQEDPDAAAGRSAADHQGRGLAGEGPAERRAGRGGAQHGLHRIGHRYRLERLVVLAFLLLHAEDDVAVHLHEAAVRIEREATVAGLGRDRVAGEGADEGCVLAGEVGTVQESGGDLAPRRVDVAQRYEGTHAPVHGVRLHLDVPQGVQKLPIVGVELGRQPAFTARITRRGSGRPDGSASPAATTGASSIVTAGTGAATWQGKADASNCVMARVRTTGIVENQFKDGPVTFTSNRAFQVDRLTTPAPQLCTAT